MFNYKVWSLARIFLADDDPALNTIPTLLSTLSRHSSPVHSVRFSWTGQYLASGGADGRVLVYHLLAGEGGTVIGSKAKNLENWAIFRVYQQNLDVSEVAGLSHARKCWFNMCCLANIQTYCSHNCISCKQFFCLMACAKTFNAGLALFCLNITVCLMN